MAFKKKIQNIAANLITTSSLYTSDFYYIFSMYLYKIKENYTDVENLTDIFNSIIFKQYGPRYTFYYN